MKRKLLTILVLALAISMLAIPSLASGVDMLEDTAKTTILQVLVNDGWHLL